MVSSLTPKLYSGCANLKVGVQETEADAIEWCDEGIIDSGVHIHKLSQPLSGRFISFRFDNSHFQDFELGGFDYDVEVLGEF